ncbi:hypothetical protein BST24_23875 [Mycobacteroides franklinii]|nr:hypothetical protein BST24_23875 [Mycobacteroides franklinii]
MAPAPTRVIVKQLKRAGFTMRDGKGGHTVWTCSHGRYTVSVDTGHREISAGVHRQVDEAIDLCEKNCKEEK